ncbi:MAG: hypothetical protein M1820_004412 [Bogoriella megaspora]|nr:MAG: hypothetical protein M1820_004412 [Bogoriella megaspora]
MNSLRPPFLGGMGRSKSTDRVQISAPSPIPNYSSENTANYPPNTASIRPTSPQSAESASLFAPSRNVLSDYNRWLKTNNKDGMDRRDGNMPHFDDPVGMHLLVENALGDSENYKILSVEEVDELKKEKVKLSAQIESIRRKLALESKVMDAAHSLNRLYSKRSKTLDQVPTLKKHRRNQQGSDSSMGSKDSDALDKTEDELAVTQKKLDDLSREMWDLDIRYRAIEQKLLKHTAGVLQATHAGPRVQMSGNPNQSNGPSRPQPPDSPQSIYSTMEKRQTSVAGNRDSFDDRSFYREADQLDRFVDRLGYRQSSIYDGDSDKPLPQPPGSAQDSGFALAAIASRLAASNKRLRDLLQETRQIGTAEFPQPPEVSAPDPQEQMNYLDELSYEIERAQRELAEQVENGASSSQIEATIAGLWKVVLASEEESRQWKRRQQEENDPDIDDGPSEPDAPTNEEFSPQAFSLKVQRLCNRATMLREQQTILRRQIQQQRDLRSEAESKNAEYESLNDELIQARARHAAAETETGDARAELAAANAEVERLRENVARGKSDGDMLQQEMSVRAAAEQRVTALERDLEAKGTEHSKTRDDLEATKIARNEAVKQAAMAEENAVRAENELRDLEGEVVRLTTELTVVRAELDGAYGTRAQRAAEGGGEELKEVKARCATLQGELQETLAEYEDLTKASIEGEKEREVLEGVVDGLRTKVEDVEARLAEERIRWMGVRSPTSGGGKEGEQTSTVVLKNEFKRMMRDTRGENMKLLRCLMQAEQEERRKLEALVRQLRKEKPGMNGAKSGLSQSTLAV